VESGNTAACGGADAAVETNDAPMSVKANKAQHLDLVSDFSSV
jgi:hypothetical protein